MSNFNRNNRFSGERGPKQFGKRDSGGRGFGGDGGRKFGGRDSGRPFMHKATCSKCGNECQLPFRPTGDRPVFCSNCFDKQGNGGGRPNKFGGERRERPRFEDKQMHDAVCAKCGKDCQVPFRPMAGKPVFCNNCFEKGGSGSKDSGEIMEQIKMLNAKIDKLMNMLTPNVSVEKNEKPEVKKEVMIEKVVREKKEKMKTKVAPKKTSTKKKK